MVLGLLLFAHFTGLVVCIVWDPQGVGRKESPDLAGVTRNEALRAGGNGVVPQQAAAALRYLLSVEAVA